MDPSLRLVTYLVPSHPIELYECIARYLEETLDVRATLQYESRDPIDLFDERPDPFLLNEADLGTSQIAASSAHCDTIKILLFMRTRVIVVVIAVVMKPTKKSAIPPRAPSLHITAAKHIFTISSVQVESSTDL